MEIHLEQILKEIRQTTGAPAIAGVVVDHHSTIAQAAIGERRLGSGEAVTLQDKFHIGSNAKAIMATLCAVLVDQGQLAWETRPQDVLPELQKSILPEYQSITLEMLLTHAAGVPPYADDEAEDFVSPPEMDGVPQAQQIAQFTRWLLQEYPPIHTPGSEFSYSNAGYVIAAAMTEAVTGKTWQENLAAYLFAPLGIADQIAYGWPALNDPQQPWGHLVNEEKKTMTPHPPDDAYQLPSWLAPAGNISLPMADYGVFLQMHLNGLQGNDTIVPAEAIQHLHNHMQPGLGMGWGIQEITHFESLGLLSIHTGSAGTFYTVTVISHSKDFAAVLSANAFSPGIGQGLMEILEAYTQKGVGN